MVLSDPPCSRLASTRPEEPRKVKKQPNAGRVNQLKWKWSKKDEKLSKLLFDQKHFYMSTKYTKRSRTETFLWAVF